MVRIPIGSGAAMKMHCSAWLLASAGALLAGCAQTERTLPMEVTSALELAFARGDVDACAAIYAEDAEIISEDAPKVVGREAIKAFFKDQAVRDISLDTDTTMNVVAGDFAVEQGTYRVRNVNSGTIVEHGEFLNFWKKTGGQWKNYRSMYNTTQGARTAVSLSLAEEQQQR
jgi:ketosteroid isomerase-like protein